MMDAIVVYESVFGNTRAVAEAVAERLGSVPVMPAREAAKRRDSVDLLVVGGPTHTHGRFTTRSRRLAAEGVHEDGNGSVEPGATEEPGLRAWLRDLPPSVAQRVAAFDTKSFLVEDSEGPLVEGELDRARAWGAELARSAVPPAVHPMEA
jgi:hypothetical protein